MDKQNPLPENIQDELFRRMKQWNRENPKATLTEMEEAVDQELSRLRGKLIEEMTGERVEEIHDKVKCPNCGLEMVKNGWKRRELRSKGGETVVINRRQMRCLECGMTLFPPG